MDYFTINKQELSALSGLPYLYQVTYFLALKPHIDFKTLTIGIKRKISYQSLAESLYIEPHSGIQSGSPSRQQLRRVLKGLERTGLINIQSNDTNLILKCPLANQPNSVKNKPDTKPTPYLDTPSTKPSMLNQEDPDTVCLSQPDTPLKDNYYIFLSQQFEIFWQKYPIKKTKQKAWDAFQQLQPNAELSQRIHASLQAQINFTKLQQTQGQWVAPWKFPANWLAQRCWEDEITPQIIQEFNYGKRCKNSRNEGSKDMFWIDDADEEGEDEQPRNNVIQFQHP